MATRKPRKKKIDTAATLQTILEKIDPIAIVAMGLGATAAGNGVVPPLTQLLASFSGGFRSFTDWSGKAPDALFKMAQTATPFGSLGLLEWLFGLIGEQQQAINELTPTEQQILDERFRRGLMASGALEALLMYKLLSNPEVLKQLIELPGEVLSGIGSLNPLK